MFRLVIIGKIGLLGIMKDLCRIHVKTMKLYGKSLDNDKGLERIVIITEIPSLIGESLDLLSFM